MKTKTCLWALLLVLQTAAFPQTADDHVAQGRAYLAVPNLGAANGSFSNAVALTSNHPVANVFYAVTRLLVLPSQPTGSNFLNRLGVPPAGRDIYNWTAEPSIDPDGLPLAPAGVSTAEFTAMMRTNVLPVVIAAEANLAKVTDTNFTLTLTSGETRGVAVTLDYGDIVLLRAMLQATKYVGYTAYSWNLDAQLSALRAYYKNEATTIEQVLQANPQLLTFATTNDLNAAKQAFQTGANLYMEASRFIRARSTNVTRLFNYDVSQAGAESDFRLTLTDLTNSLLTAVPLSLDTNYTIYLGAHFSGTHSPRSFLPQFRDNGFGLSTLPDATFGGLVYGITSEQVDDFLRENLSPLPTIGSGGKTVGGQFQFPLRVVEGHGYAIQVSTDLITWSDYFTFLATSNTFNFVDPDSLNSSQRYYRVQDRYTTLNLGEALNHLSGAAGSEAHFVVTVPPGKSYLGIYIQGGTGDCDLYVKFSSLPTLKSWDARPYLHGNQEYVNFWFPPQPGTWHIMLHGYKSYSGVSLVAY